MKLRILIPLLITQQIIMKELNIQDEKDIILFSSVTKTGKNEIYDEIGKYIS